MLRVLREREFRLLWLGQSASMVGDRLVFVALALYVTEIGTPTDVGIVLAAHAFTLVACLMLGGVWADRLPRHRLMLATDLVRAAVQGLLAALILFGAAEVWMIVCIGIVYGAAEAFFRPAYTGLVPQTVPDELLQDAQSATALVETVSEFVGPALATALVLGVGAGWAFGLDAATFLVSAFFLVQMRPHPRGERTAAASSIVSELRSGWGEFVAHAWVWGTVAIFSVMLLVALAPYFVLGPTVAEELYGDRAIFGILAAALGAGSIAGALIGFRWRPARPMLAGLALNVTWPGAVTAYALGLPEPFLAIIFVLAGVGFSLFGVWWQTALAQHIPPHALSRVSSYDWMGSLALLPLGYLLAGPLGEALGNTEVLLAGGLLGIAAAALGLAIPDVWRLRAVSGGG